ncbi:MAG: putative phage abortive infection protein [Saprospiraceae bacterium]|nr:putative phage abortive infection protein [Saprospiraceae bacterium]
MIKFNSRSIAYLSIITSIVLTLWFLIFGGYVGGDFKKPDLDRIRELQPFISGIAVPLITFGTSLLVVETFRNSMLQNISNNFFKLIDQNRKILDGVNVDTTHLPEGDIKSKGKDFFDDLCGRISTDYEAIEKNDIQYLLKMESELKSKTLGKKGKDLLVSIYDYYYHIHQSDLGHYFRNLFYIVRYITNSNIRKIDKTEFIKILRSQLSNYELLLLAYNGLHPYGEKFYPFIVDYELLKSLNNELKLPNSFKKRIIDLEILKNGYPFLKKYWT